MSLLTFALAYPLAYIFASQDNELFDLSVHVIRIYSFIFMLAGLTFFASSFFTALNNGLVSAIISFVRVVVFQTGCILILPLIFKEEGIWYSMIVSETMGLMFAVIFLVKLRKKYNY